MNETINKQDESRLFSYKRENGKWVATIYIPTLNTTVSEENKHLRNAVTDAFMRSVKIISKYIYDDNEIEKLKGLEVKNESSSMSDISLSQSIEEKLFEVVDEIIEQKGSFDDCSIKIVSRKGFQGYPIENNENKNTNTIGMSLLHKDAVVMFEFPSQKESTNDLIKKDLLDTAHKILYELLTSVF